MAVNHRGGVSRESVLLSGDGSGLQRQKRWITAAAPVNALKHERLFPFSLPETEARDNVTAAADSDSDLVTFTDKKV